MSAPSATTPLDADPSAAPARPLRSGTFRLLVAGWTLANVADSILSLVLAVWVADLTGSAALGGATFVLIGLPALAAPLLGQLADRVSRRRMLVASYLVGAAALLPLVAVQRPGDVWLLYAATAVYGLVSYATAACQSGILRDLLPDAALGAANARLSTIDQVLRIAGPFGGAALYAAAGPVPVVGIAAAGFAGAAIVFALVRLTETQDDRAPGRPWRREVAAGFAHLLRTRPLAGMTGTLVVAMAAVGILNAVAFALLELLGLPAHLLGLVTAVQGVTGVVAGLTAPRLLARAGRVRAYALGLVAVGIGMAPMAFPVLPGVVAGLAVVGWGVTTLVVAYVTERQIATPAALQGRTSAAAQVALVVPQVAATAAGAALLAVADVRVLTGLAALVVLAAGAAALRLRTDVGGGV